MSMSDLPLLSPHVAGMSDEFLKELRTMMQDVERLFSLNGLESDCHAYHMDLNWGTDETADPVLAIPYIADALVAIMASSNWYIYNVDWCRLSMRRADQAWSLMCLAVKDRSPARFDYEPSIPFSESIARIKACCATQEYINANNK